jgi:hypothetical protein
MGSAALSITDTTGMSGAPLTRLLPENLTNDGIRARMRQPRQEGVRWPRSPPGQRDRRLMASGRNGIDLIRLTRPADTT